MEQERYGYHVLMVHSFWLDKIEYDPKNMFDTIEQAVEYAKHVWQNIKEYVFKIDDSLFYHYQEELENTVLMVGRIALPFGKYPNLSPWDNLMQIDKTNVGLADMFETEYRTVFQLGRVSESMNVYLGMIGFENELYGSLDEIMVRLKAVANRLLQYVQTERLDLEEYQIEILEVKESYYKNRYRNTFFVSEDSVKREVVERYHYHLKECVEV